MEFYGNFILTSNFILLCLLDIVFLGQGIFVLCYPNPRSGFAILMDLFWIASFSFLLGAQLCYFTLDEDDLEIRNHVFRWYRRKYGLKTIEKLSMERATSGMSRSLRVNSSGSKPWRFYAGSLRDKDWHDLRKALKKRGIPVEGWA